MSRETVQTLFHPFEMGEVPFPEVGSKCLVFGGERDFSIPEMFVGERTFVQGFRPDFLALQKRGFEVVPEPQGTGYSYVLVLAGRHRGQNERWIAEAVQRAAPDGLIVVAGGKTEGVASLRKRLEKLVPLRGHLSKNHGIVFWFVRGVEAERAAQAILDEQAHAALVEGRFETAAGMFSHDRVDAGSRLLAEALPQGFSGIAADFCAGWGYLSTTIAERTGASRIDLYEADYASLEAARRNMSRLASGVDAHFHWCDLTIEKVERIYDMIVMNPPFHQGRAADPGLGQAMIRAAAAALKPRGRLFMVANRGLPYEPLLKSAFSTCEIISEDKGFRVYSALR